MSELQLLYTLKPSMKGFGGRSAESLRGQADEPDFVSVNRLFLRVLP